MSFVFSKQPWEQLRDVLYCITEALERVSSLRRSEANDVARNIIKLQQGAVAELATQSTNPSAPAIALQALAGFHAYYPHQLTIPEAVVQLLREHFNACFRNTTDIFRFELTNLNKSDIERYTRAMLLLPHKFATIDGYRLESFMVPPKDLNEAVLLMCAPGEEKRSSQAG